jgi:hypothetical protein
MLDSFLVRNFRLFEDLRIDRLRQINLFVGKNNSGKSCLLEALQLYASNASLDVILSTIAAHDGHWEAEIQPEPNATTFQSGSSLKSIFRGFLLPSPGAIGIELGPCRDPSQRVELQIAAYQTARGGEGAKLVQISPSTVVRDLLNVEVWLVAKEGDTRTPLAPVERLGDPQYRHRMSLASWPEYHRRYRYPFYALPAENLDDRQVASQWDSVDQTDMESEVLIGLQLIEPRIRGVGFLGKTGTIGRIGIIRLSDSPERYPLKSMGDGLTRVLQMILALVSAKDGILLIDEFENGLHWTVQPKLWQLVFRLSKRLKVQVFATTHSQDCIKAFSSVWQDDEEAATFHRLDRDSRNGVKVTTYDRSTLSDSVETEVEVR